MLKTRVFIAKVESIDDERDYRDWDSLSEKEQEEMRIKLNVQYLKSIGAKNIRVKEKIK